MYAWMRVCINASLCSMSIGDKSILGDRRWAGLYGVDADFVALDNCKIVAIEAADFLVGRASEFACVTFLLCVPVLRACASVIVFHCDFMFGSVCTVTLDISAVC